jgi:hypothetical protein
MPKNDFNIMKASAIYQIQSSQVTPVLCKQATFCLIKHIYSTVHFQEKEPEPCLMQSRQIVNSDFKYQIINYDLSTQRPINQRIRRNEEQKSPYQATIP